MIQSVLYLLACLAAFAIAFLVGRHILGKMALTEPWPTVVGLLFLIFCLWFLAGGLGAYNAPWRFWHAALRVIAEAWV